MSEFKYQKVKKTIELAIEKGIFTERLPSVRSYAQQHKISISTVQKAYQQLELNGMIQAKPQRGYFVKHMPNNKVSAYGKTYQKVATSALLEQQVLHSLNDKAIFPLSCTAPSSLNNNEQLLSRHHKKTFNRSIYRFEIEDEVQGNLKLRQAISHFLYRQQTNYNADDIIITSGRRESLLVALAATGNIGGCVAVESPTSFYFQSCIKRLCSEVVEVPMQNDFHQELKLLQKAHVEFKFNTYLVNPNFNDPTGRLLTDKQKLDLLQWSANCHITLIEYDRGLLNFSGFRPASLADLSELVPGSQVICIQDFFDTVSSRINLGFMLSKTMSEPLLAAKQTLTEEPNLQVQALMHSLIRSGDYENTLNKLSYKLNKNYLATLKILKQELPSDIQFSQVQGGPCLWFQLGEQSSLALWQALIEKGIAIAPGNMFSLQGKYDNYCRITFALPWNSNMEWAVRQVCRSIEAIKRQ